MRLLLLLCFCLSSCSTLEFYSQAALGQLEISTAQRETREVLGDPSVASEIKDKLILAQKVRDFAKTQLQLPAGKSYTSYADLEREHVSWVVTAAPEFSFKAETWFYPFVGELSYRGYFEKDAAATFAETLRKQNFDVQFAGVDAYSTLGVFRDPVLNTFIDYSDVRFVELLMHELTHRRIFLTGETTFNEGLAVVVGRAGTRQFLRQTSQAAALANYEKGLRRTDEFIKVLTRSTETLNQLYASDKLDSNKRLEKARIFHALQDELATLRESWGGQGLESWLNQPLGNAHITSVLTYYAAVPWFESLLSQHDGNVPMFLAAIEENKKDYVAALRQWLEAR